MPISIKDGNGNDVSNNASHIANINPFRYRAYYYDKETGMYYLNSRYYVPQWGRFLNADGTLADASAGLLGHNMYIYCANDPINRYDPTGTSSKLNKPTSPFAAQTLGPTWEEVTAPARNTSSTTSSGVTIYLKVHPVAAGNDHTSIIIRGYTGDRLEVAEHFSKGYMTIGAGGNKFFGLRWQIRK